MTDPVTAAATEPFLPIAGGVHLIVVDIVTWHSAKLELIVDQAVKIKRTPTGIAIQEAIGAVVEGNVMVHFRVG